MGSGVFNEVWPSAKTRYRTCVQIGRAKLLAQNSPGWDSNRPGIKEGCAERIARFGTLSQNGYGDNKGRSKGTDPGALQFCGTDPPH